RTKDIITSVNGLKLYEKGLISDAGKHSMALIVSNSNLELYELSSMANNSKADYIRILKKWFFQEKIFISEIIPFLNNSSVSSTTSRPNRTDLTYNIHYLGQIKELKLKATFPIDKARLEIGELHKKNSINILLSYNAIC